MFRLLTRHARVTALAGAQISLLSANTSTFCVSKHDAVTHAKHERERRDQYAAAMAWVQESDEHSAFKATKAVNEDGTLRWPLVDRSGLLRRLSGQVNNEDPYEARSALTHDEECAIVAACKDLNRHGQGVERKQLERMVIDSLKLRPVVNRGRRYKPLSRNAKAMLAADKVGADWFTYFFATHPDIKEKQPCSEEIARATWMTKANSLLHFERLGAVMAGIPGFLIDGKIADPRRVLNSDECPNPFGGTGGKQKVVGGAGEPCRKLVSSARQHTSLDVMVGLDGHIFGPHLIFAGKTIQRQMVPDPKVVQNSIISATEKGYQIGDTLLAALKIWDRDLVARNVPKPIIWCTDGHASRLNLAVLTWCRGNGWIMYLSPPHTTGIHQPLDQIFRTWHTTFNKAVRDWSDMHIGQEVDKSAFALIFSRAWPIWTRADAVVAAFRHCGISVAGLNPSAIPDNKFIVSLTVTYAKDNFEVPSSSALTPLCEPSGASASSSAGGASASASASTETAVEDVDLDVEWTSPSPAKGTYKTRIEYLELKAKLASAAARAFKAVATRLRDTPLTLKDTHPAFKPKKIEEPPLEEGWHRKKRATLKGEWGDVMSIQGADLIKKLEEQEAAEKQAQQEREARKRTKDAQREERAAEEQRKSDERSARLLAERPVLDLLKKLYYVAGNADEVSGAAMVAFAKANRASLREMGIDPGAQPTKKALMPALMDKLPAFAGTPEWAQLTWNEAPPLLLMAPTDEPNDRAASPPRTRGEDEDMADKGTPDKPPEKRTCTSNTSGEPVAP